MTFILEEKQRILSEFRAAEFKPVSADFVRQLSGSMVLKKERSIVNDLFHLDLPIVFILVLVSLFQLVRCVHAGLPVGHICGTV